MTCVCVHTCTCVAVGEHSFSPEEAESHRAPAMQTLHAATHSVQMPQEDVGPFLDKVEANKFR